MTETLLRGPIHDLDAGTYRAIVRDGVPMIERDDLSGAVRAVLIPVSGEMLRELSSEWTEPLHFRIEDGQFVFRRPL